MKICHFISLLIVYGLFNCNYSYERNLQEDEMNNDNNTDISDNNSTNTNFTENNSTNQTDSDNVDNNPDNNSNNQTNNTSNNSTTSIDILTLGELTFSSCGKEYNKETCCIPKEVSALDNSCLLFWKTNNKELYCIDITNKSKCPTVVNGGCSNESNCVLNKLGIYKAFTNENPFRGSYSIILDLNNKCSDPKDEFLCPNEENGGCSENCPFLNDGSLNPNFTLNCNSDLYKHYPKCTETNQNNNNGDSSNNTIGSPCKCTSSSTTNDGVYDEFNICVCSTKCTENCNGNTNNQNNNNDSTNVETDINDQILICIDNPGTCVERSSTLLYSFFLINPSAHFPTNMQRGTYQILTKESLRSYEETDLFKETQWNDFNYNNYVSRRMSDSIIPSFKRLYQKANITNSDGGYLFLSSESKITQTPNEIVFITLTNSISKQFTNSFILNFYNMLDTTVEEIEYNNSNLLANEFFKDYSIPNLLVINKDYGKINLGFEYNQCKNFNNWKKFKSESKFIKDNIRSRYSSIVNTWYNHILNGNNTADFYDKSGNIIYTFKNETKFDDIEKLGMLTKLYITNERLQFKSRTKDFSIDIKNVIQLDNFITYNIDLASMLHTYLSVQPILNIIENTFNAVMSNKTESYPKGSKMMFMTLNTHLFTALHKLLNYDLSKKDDLIFNPTISHEYSLQIELWRNKEDKHYIAFRENMKPYNHTIMFFKDVPEFSKYLKRFYDNTGFSDEERIKFCG